MEPGRPDLLSIAEGLMTNHLGHLPLCLKQAFPGVDFGLSDSRAQNSLFWLDDGGCFSMGKHSGDDVDLHHQGIVYAAETKTLFYRIAHDDMEFYVYAHPVSRGACGNITDYIRQIEPAVQRYLRLYSLASENLTSLVLPLYTHLFSGQSFSEERFFTLTHDYLDPSKQYYVIVRAFNPDNEFSPQQLTSIAHSLVRDKSTQIFNFIYENRSLMVVSVDGDYEPGDYRSYRMMARIVHERTRRNMSPACDVQTGIGRPKRIGELFDSYKEACCAQAFGIQSGESDFTLAFGDLGGIEPILEKPPAEILEYCSSILGTLLEEERGGLKNHLLDTLRTFFESNFQYKKAADELYIHPNTLRYRIGKAFSLMNRNQDSVYDLSTVYLAIKSWDILRQCSFFDLDEA